MRPELLAVALVAAGALAFEVLLTRLLAIVHWHHFAGMVISLALLGYGASGSLLAPLLDRLRPHAPLAFAGAATLFGVAAVAAVALAQAVPFNALEVVWTPRQWLWLALLYLLFAVPFFFAAACTGLALACFPAPVGRIYRSDLLGAGAGALAAVGLLAPAPPGPGAAAGRGVRAARRGDRAGAERAIGPRPSPPRWWPPPWWASRPEGWPGLRISPFKPLPQTLLVEGTSVVAERTSPIGLVQVVRSERIPFRIAPGLSLMNRQEPAPQLGLFVDGEGPTPITRFDGDFGPLAYLDATLAALPYRLLDRPARVLLLGLGGGADLLLALRHDARSVDVVEPDGNVADLLRGELAGFAGAILDRPEVRLHVDAARRFASAAGEAEYDLIRLEPRAGGGRSTLAENFATTVEAFAAYLRRLAPGGLLALPHPLRLPPRESLKLALTAMEALERLGAGGARPAPRPGPRLGQRPAARPAHAVRGGRTSPRSKRSPRSSPSTSAGTRPCPARRPTASISWASRCSSTASPPWPVRTARPSSRTTPSTSAPRRTTGPTSSTSSAGARCRRSGRRRAAGNAGLLDWGWPLQLATLGVAALFGLALILLPARVLARRADAGLRRATAAYFLLVGAGFMFTEIAAMQRLVLLFGHPVYAFAATLAAFLVFAGLGSGAAARLDAARSGDDGGGVRRWRADRLDLRRCSPSPGLRRCTPWPGRGCFRWAAPGSARSRAPSWPWRWSRRWPSPWGCPSRWCWPASGRPLRRWCPGPGA